MNKFISIFLFLLLTLLVSSCGVVKPKAKATCFGQARVFERTVVGSLPQPTYYSTATGIVVVRVKIDQYGQVMEAIPGAEGTTITDNTLWDAVRKAALMAQFNQDVSAPVLQLGAIIYVFGDVDLPEEPPVFPLVTVKELVENEPYGIYRIIAKYVETYDSSKLLFSVRDHYHCIPVQLVMKDLGAEDRFKSLDLHKGDTLVIEGTRSMIEVRHEVYSQGLKDAVIIDKREIINQHPTFMDGDLIAFSKWMVQHLEYPEVAKENNIQGKVTLQFTVEEDGSVTNVKVFRGVDEALDKEAVRVVSSSPKWDPGYIDGKPIKVTYTCPVIFQLR